MYHNDDDVLNQNDYDYDIDTTIIDNDHTTDSVHSIKLNLGYGKEVEDFSIWIQHTRATSS